MKAPPSGSKPRKPYYLKEYLQFILPYIKATQPTQNSGNIPEVVNEETQEVILEGDQEEPDEQTESNNLVEDETGVAEPTPEKTQTLSAKISTRPLTERRRKRPVAEGEQVFINYLKSKTKKVEREKTEISESNNTISSTQHFLMSLVPDLESMTEQQKRTFKIKVLMLIEEIKSHQGPYQSPSYFTAVSTGPSRSSSTQATVSTPLISPQTSTQFSPIYYTQTSSPNPEEHVPESRNETNEKSTNVYTYFSDFQ